MRWLNWNHKQSRSHQESTAPSPIVEGSATGSTGWGGVHHLQRDASSLTGVLPVVRRTTGRHPAPEESPLLLQVHDRSVDSCVVTFRWPRNSWHSFLHVIYPIIQYYWRHVSLVSINFVSCFLSDRGGRAGLWSGSVFEVRLGYCGPAHCYDASPLCCPFSLLGQTYQYTEDLLSLERVGGAPLLPSRSVEGVLPVEAWDLFLSSHPDQQFAAFL